jgi:2-polyprenyl-3-methyl-5-hydroxy-6-metoxy-1,4-benzoquinol methylase
MNVLKQIVHSAGHRYSRAIAESEYRDQSFKRINERPIEYGFVFQSIGRYCPKTILDVGTGTSALPSLMRTCGPVVKAIDNIRDYWPEGMVNRHYHVADEDATKAISGSYDMVTCISVLEHIRAHDDAVKMMLGAVNPGGCLLLTSPYNEQEYIPNVYALPGAGYGKDLPYVAQVYSRKELDRWFQGASIEVQEYWQVFSGPYWTFGETLRPAVRAAKDSLHQLTCLAIRK